MSNNEAPFEAEVRYAGRVAADPEAFIALYDLYFRRVYNYVRYRCQDPALTDDITAQAFEQALDHIGDYRPERAPFGAWLFTIARNLVNQHLRTSQRRVWLPLDEVGEYPGEYPTPEEILINAETQAELLAALQQVSGRDRDLLSLKFAAGLTNRRIATITGLTESNVGIILYRALRKLRIALLVKELTND
ncbi:MAG TPA: sigma-70 family RNA polymerase sigma factor [Anaerolineales bacterium]